ERAARVRVELDALVDELARSTNHVGRSRPFMSSNERARTAVQKAVRRTLDHIEGSDPTLGATLRQCVHTGRTCSYDPTPCPPPPPPPPPPPCPLPAPPATPPPAVTSAR